ncbi:hypothetical protein AVEN_1744-2-1, partial [Araneus ventricosus]
LETAGASVESREEKLQLQSELETSLVWKKKCEVFYEDTRAVIEKYKSQVGEFVAETKQMRAAKPLERLYEKRTVKTDIFKKISFIVARKRIRMVKMETATLPFQGKVDAHVSSESENEVSKLRK